jgi:hypothetical protein
MVHGSVASTEMKRGRQRDGAIRTDIDARQKRATLKECMLLAVENDTNPKRKRGRNALPRLRFGLVGKVSFQAVRNIVIPRWVTPGLAKIVCLAHLLY